MKLKFSLLCAALVLSACASSPPPNRLATATMYPTYGGTVSGKVRFVPQADSNLLVMGEINGLVPYSEHGFHVHEKGDCSGNASMGLSTGGHFNPEGRPHGRYADTRYHAGDLPVLQADANGVARFSFSSNHLSIGSGPHDILGRSLVLHRDMDDLQSQPSGNSGPAIACGVVMLE